MDNEKELSAVNEEAPLSGFARFEDWLTNSFWFHYKWYFILAVFGVTVLILALVGLAGQVEYDWRVVYAHYGQEDPAACKELKGLLEGVLPETGKNRRVDVELVDLAYGGPAPGTGSGESADLMAENGEYRLYAFLEDQNCYLYILDADTFKRFSGLGYFSDGRPLGSLPRYYAATNDAQVKLLSASDPAYSDYSQDFLDDVNAEYAQEHEELLAIARETVGKLG